jgi:tetratricopeptide (TPR) repeat protein
MTEEKTEVVPQITSDASDQVAALLQADQDHVASQTLDETRAKFETVLALDPENTEAHYLLGRFHHTAEAYELAEKHYRAALKGSSPCHQALLDLGALYEHQHKPEAAEELYEHCFETATCPEHIAQARAALAKQREQPFQVCQTCARFTTLEDFSAYGSGEPNVCPRCYGDKQLHQAHQGLLMLLVYLALINFMLLPFVAAEGDNPLYVWANNTLVLSLLYLMIPLHELAHAGASWLLGGKVHEIRLGIGSPIWETKWRGIKLSIHRYPAGGFCMPSFPTRKRILWRTFLTSAAGAGLSGLLMGLLSPAYDGHAWVQRLAWGEALVWVNGFLLFFGLWPRKVNLGTVHTEIDGAQLLKILNGETSADVCHMHHYLLENMYALADRDFTQAADASRQGLSRYPDSLHLKNVHAIALLEMREGPDAAALFQEQLDALDTKGPGEMIGVTEENHIMLRALLLNNLAVALMLGPDGPHAEHSLLDYAQAAYLLKPWHHAVESTWGGALVERGCAELRLAYLKEAYPAHETDHDQASTLASIAWAYHVLGEEEASADALQQALALDDAHPAVKIRTKMQIT